MKNILNYFMMLVVSGNLLSCSNSGNQTNPSNIRNYAELSQASWLLGEWQNHSEEGKSIEIWERKNDSTFSGKSCFVVGNDTVSSETISLEQHGSALFYIPTVKSHNNNQAVKFVMTSSTENQLVFENPKHDFPQKISYRKQANDSLVAEISGIVDGKANSIVFPMKRVK